MILLKKDIENKFIRKEKWELWKYLMKLSCNECFLRAVKSSVTVTCLYLVHGFLYKSFHSFFSPDVILCG